MFVWKPFVSHSGIPLDYKIECEHFTDEDWECLARIIATKTGWVFGEVCGVPRGGTELARKLMPFRNAGSRNILIVDDVYTTGRSMEEAKRQLLSPPRSDGIRRAIGVVVFSRSQVVPNWIWPIFQLSPTFGP
jgi:hypothetical protein